MALELQNFQFTCDFLGDAMRMGDQVNNIASIRRRTAASIEPKTAVPKEVLPEPMLLRFDCNQAFHRKLSHVVIKQQIVLQIDHTFCRDDDVDHRFAKESVEIPMMHRNHQQRANAKTDNRKTFTFVGC